jgi:hypothetical protein
MQGKKQMV